MKKEYRPLNMILSGRYAALWKTLSDKEKDGVLSRMESLIDEEREYEDDGNYSHLCNILPTIAIDEILQKEGKTSEEAYGIISSHMWAALTPDLYRRLSHLPFFLSLMKKIIPIGFRKGSGKGWKYTFFKDENRDEFRFECNECLYHHIFGKRGLLPRFGKMFCHSDIINFGNLHRIDFQRKRTLCQGGGKCDFRFVRHPKGEPFGRFPSI